MSGAPIIQDSKFVGAVTHVLVNNPALGYRSICRYDVKANIINKKGRISFYINLPFNIIYLIKNHFLF